MVSFKGNMVSCLRSVQADLPMPKVVGTSFESRPRSTSSNPPKEGSARRTALSDGKSTVGYPTWELPGLVDLLMDWVPLLSGIEHWHIIMFDA